ncbi:MAG: pre-peptidase C-terminal domain-containing protein [Cyanobacteria bacterium P01_F01_bin.150]
MKDLAGSSLKKAQKINFRNKNKKIKGFIGSSDSLDIFRFKARSSSIDITTRKLDEATTNVALYKVDNKVNKTLKKIGKTEFTDLKRKRRNRFLSSVDLTTTPRQNRTTYSSDIQKGTYFLVVSSSADTNSRYTVKFQASDLATIPTDSTNPVTPTDSTNPVTPTDSTNPVTPTAPTNPVTPTAPTNPVIPTEPTIPITPTEPITTDAIGNTIDTAQLISLGGNQVEAVGGTDSADVFQFVLGDRQTVSLTLSGLTQNADLSLLDSSGNDLVISNNSNTVAESIIRNLEQGTYYIKVASSSATGTNYTLTTSGNAPQETALYAPDGSTIPQSQGELRFAQLPFTATEADVVADSLSGGNALLKPGFLATLNTLGLVATTDATEILVSNGVQINSQVNNSNTGYVGYSNYTIDYSSLELATRSADLIPVNSSGITVLDADKGYTVSFELSIQSESSNSDNRAGFSIVVVSSDGQRAIELGFDDGGIFAQSQGFEAENTVSPTAFAMSDLVAYDLYVAGSGYQLFANGSPIMSGTMKSPYTFNPASSDPPLPFNPYTTQNFLFFGDNTDESSATFTLGKVSLFT